MKRLVKQLLTGVIALGLLAPVATSTINNNPQTTVNAKSRWHYGVPRAIKGHWRTGFMRSNQEYHHGYWKDNVYVSRNKYGFDPFPFWYNSHKHFKMSGATTGSFWDPYYRYEGHHTYKIICGGTTKSMNPTHSLRSELRSKDHMYYTIHMHGHNHFSARNGRFYDGYFHRI